MSQRRIITRTKTKAEIRDEIARDVDRFLSSGGEVKDIPSGTSGNEDNANLFSHSTQFEPRKSRTPVTEVVKELEARKNNKHANAHQPPPKGPQKRLITDDFGEPIRWVWEEQ